jgi:hypothetical protein
MTFQLDTSGHVSSDEHGWSEAWSDLDPFTQGYVEAFLRDCWSRRMRDVHGGLWPVKPAFSDLSPETLARIVEDCAEIKDAEPHDIWTKGDGEAFWRDRNDGCHLGVQPLTAYLGDDGKVYLREASQ